MRYIVFLTLSALVACSNQPDTKTMKAGYSPIMSEYTLHDYAGDLAMQLLKNSTNNLHDGSIIVEEFTSLQDKHIALSSDITPQLGRQLQQSMQTLLSNAGFQVVSIDSVNNLVSNHHNNMNSAVTVNYILHGSLTNQQHAYIVNAKLIDLATQRIVAAASTEIPLNVFWSREQVQLRNGHLYRIESQGVK
ncbi:hypothetical protein E0Z06_10540 [Rheinheimera sp. D18]|uniref:FlgO family outer membrane protein n=1 Tax=Rheinheimera sp. D18 TaxID=2545632 RepID=UPI001045697F|nr:FlgO family outer membrane protein [Rheinheimera sp. D18]QBL09931.1 hypothetical protein E0Z06_10540 [Rheinheimera sp. D18]